MNSDVNDLDDLGAGAEGQPAADAGETTAASDDLSKAVEEREQLRDRLLRTTAEFDNFRKRVDRDRREMADRAAEGLLLDLLPVVTTSSEPWRWKPPARAPTHTAAVSS